MVKFLCIYKSVYFLEFTSSFNLKLSFKLVFKMGQECQANVAQ